MGFEIMIIRPIKVADIKPLIDCIQAQAIDADLHESDKINADILAENIRDAIIANHYAGIVATENEEIVGYIYGLIGTKHWNDKKYGEILYIFIKPENRSKKIADELMQNLVNWFRKNNCDYYVTSIMHFNKNYEPMQKYMDRAALFYKTQGMQTVGHYMVKQIKDYDG
jgi:ribosomal protein S18 acetylase RimI-like enzyme